MFKRLQEKQNDLFIYNEILVLQNYMMVARREKKRGKGRKKKKNSTQLPEQEIVNRQVKTRLHWPTRSSYHTIYLSDFPTCKTKRNHPFMKRLSADFHKEMTSLECG